MMGKLTKLSTNIFAFDFQILKPYAMGKPITNNTNDVRSASFKDKKMGVKSGIYYLIEYPWATNISTPSSERT